MTNAQNQFNPNEGAEAFKKLAELAAKDLPKTLQSLTKAAEMLEAEQKFNMVINNVSVEVQVSKAGQVTILPQDKRVVEEIIKRLRDDRHT